jgi:hypothetical protein
MFVDCIAASSRASSCDDCDDSDGLPSIPSLPLPALMPLHAHDFTIASPQFRCRSTSPANLFARAGTATSPHSTRLRCTNPAKLVSAVSLLTGSPIVPSVKACSPSPSSVSDQVLRRTNHFDCTCRPPPTHSKEVSVLIQVVARVAAFCGSKSLKRQAAQEEEGQPWQRKQKL